MAYGKNKGLSKSKKGNKKKVSDPFLRKVWYDIKAPTYFKSSSNKCGRTMVTKTTGTKIETEGLKGRVAEFNLADLNDIQEDGCKKIKLIIEETQGKACLTDFHSMSFTRDKICQMIKKKHSLIEANCDCKTTDGYVIRLFCTAFTCRAQNMTRQFCKAQSSQVRRIRKKIVQVIKSQVEAGQLKDCMKSLISGTIEKEIQKLTQRIYPLDPVHITKAKIVKKPKLDITKLMEIHNKVDEGESAIPQNEEPEAKNLVDA